MDVSGDESVVMSEILPVKQTITESKSNYIEPQIKEVCIFFMWFVKRKSVRDISTHDKNEFVKCSLNCMDLTLHMRTSISKSSIHLQQVIE